MSCQLQSNAFIHLHSHFFGEAMAIAAFDSGIDFSFAICPRRKPTGYERTSFYRDSAYDPELVLADAADGDELRRRARRLVGGVTFANEVVSRVISVPRYEEKRLGELFYNRLDVMRFKQEYRLERMGVLTIW